MPDPVILFLGKRLVVRSKRLVGLVVLLPLWIASSARGSFVLDQNDILLDLHRDARKAQAERDYKAAIRNYEQIIKLRPEMAEAHANLGVLYYQQGNQNQASIFLKKAIELKPNLSGPYFFLGVLSFNARDYEQASKYLKRGQDLEASNFLIPLYLGYTHYARSNYAQAVRHFEKVVAMTGNNTDALFHLSKAYGHLSKQFFERLQRTFQNSFYNHLSRAHFFEAEQNWEGAKTEYSRALEKHPQSERLRQRLRWVTNKASGLSDSLLESTSADSIIDGSMKVLYASPTGAKIKDNQNYYQNQVQALAKQSDRSAENLYLLAENYQILSYLASLWVTEIDPDSYRAHQLKGQYYETLEKDEDAINEYRRALELKPELQNIHFAIGNLHWRRGRSEEALIELQQELKVSPNHPEAFYEIADILFTQSKLKDAREYYLKALSFEPGMTEAHLGIERIYSSEGQYERALDHLRKVIERSPADPTPHYRMSTIYRKLGRSRDAQREMKIFEQLKTPAQQ